MKRYHYNTMYKAALYLALLALSLFPQTHSALWVSPYPLQTPQVYKTTSCNPNDQTAACSPNENDSTGFQSSAQSHLTARRALGKMPNFERVRTLFTRGLYKLSGSRNDAKELRSHLVDTKIEPQYSSRTAAPQSKSSKTSQLEGVFQQVEQSDEDESYSQTREQRMEMLQSRATSFQGVEGLRLNGIQAIDQFAGICNAIELGIDALGMCATITGCWMRSRVIGIRHLGSDIVNVFATWTGRQLPLFDGVDENSFGRERRQCNTKTSKPTTKKPVREAGRTQVGPSVRASVPSYINNGARGGTPRPHFVGTQNSFSSYSRIRPDSAPSGWLRLPSLADARKQASTLLAAGTVGFGWTKTRHIRKTSPGYAQTNPAATVKNGCSCDSCPHPFDKQVEGAEEPLYQIVKRMESCCPSCSSTVGKYVANASQGSGEGEVEGKENRRTKFSNEKRNSGVEPESGEYLLRENSSLRGLGVSEIVDRATMIWKEGRTDYFQQFVSPYLQSLPNAWPSTIAWRRTLDLAKERTTKVADLTRSAADLNWDGKTRTTLSKILVDLMDIEESLTTRRNDWMISMLPYMSSTSSVISGSSPFRFVGKLVQKLWQIASAVMPPSAIEYLESGALSMREMVARSMFLRKVRLAKSKAVAAVLTYNPPMVQWSRLFFSWRLSLVLAFSVTMTAILSLLDVDNKVSEIIQKWRNALFTRKVHTTQTRPGRRNLRTKRKRSKRSKSSSKQQKTSRSVPKEPLPHSSVSENVARIDRRMRSDAQ